MNCSTADMLMGESTISVSCACAVQAYCNAAQLITVANCGSAEVLLLYTSTATVVPQQYSSLQYAT